MAVGESDNNEEVNKGKKALLGPGKDAISISQDPELFTGSHGSSDSSSLFSSEPSSSEDFTKIDVENTASSTPPIEEQHGETMHIPTTHMMERDGRIPHDAFVTSDQSPAPSEWSFVSNESLFSIQNGITNLGRDQTLTVSASETSIPEDPTKPNDGPFSPPPASVEPSHDKTKGSTTGKKKAPKEDAKPSNSSHRSNGSESSSYSFAFPLLQQNGTTKEDGGSHKKKSSRRMGEDHSISRPSPPPNSREKNCCLSFRSLFPCSSCRPNH